MPHRLVCIVEGEGEVQALPNLCARIINYLSVHDWLVDADPIRRKRTRLVDESVKSPARPCRDQEVERAVEMALARPANAALVLCDSDDDCPGFWAGTVHRVASQRLRLAAVMAVREFETWLLTAHDEASLQRARITDIEKVRDAKGALERLVPGYAPTTHQLMLTRLIDIEAARHRSRSFDKLVRSIASLCGATAPPLAPVTHPSRKAKRRTK